MDKNLKFIIKFRITTLYWHNWTL